MGKKRSPQTILGQWHINCIARFFLSSETQGQSVGSGKKAGRKFSIQVRAEEPLGNDSHQTISENSSRYRLLIGHKKINAFLCLIGKQFLLLSLRESLHDSYCLAALPGSFTKLVRTKETFIPNQKQRNYRWVEKTFWLLSARAILNLPWEYSVFDRS